VVSHSASVQAREVASRAKVWPASTQSPAVLVLSMVGSGLLARHRPAFCQSSTGLVPTIPHTGTLFPPKELLLQAD
jgi:hypothetical protein